MPSAFAHTSPKHIDYNLRTFLKKLAPLFNEGVMGLLALVAVATALGPMVFDLNPDIERALTVVEWVLVAMFAAEFLIQGAVEDYRRTWILNRWNRAR